jgi:hypothetical protein
VSLSPETLHRVLEEYIDILTALTAYEPASDAQTRVIDMGLRIVHDCIDFEERGDLDKAARYLGFLEGMLWQAGFVTEGQIRARNARTREEWMAAREARRVGGGA